MELINDFEVDLPVDEAWVVLTDVERIAPCMPGAELREVEGDEYRGVVKVKVGPITAEYKGKASFVELDSASHHAVLLAQGRDTRGQGNASATISATLEPRDASTYVSVVTDLTISGRVAQFGRGVLAEVSNKLMSEFVDRLHASLSSTAGAHDSPRPGEVLASSGARDETAGDETGPDETAGDETATDKTAGDETAGDETAGDDTAIGETAAGDGPVPRGAVRAVDRPEVAPVDLVSVAGWPVLKKVLPAALAAVLLWLLVTRLRGKRLSGSGDGS